MADSETTMDFPGEVALNAPIRRSVGRGEGEVRPVFLVTVARSGSTLLRFLLDAHPDITCPPELNLSVMMRQVQITWNRVVDAFGFPPAPVGEVAETHPAVVRHARRSSDDLMVTMADHAGASVFCDKSLTTVDDIPIVSECYPDAHYIFLYRYPLDMIASGIEAQRWGYHSYGFGPFVQNNVGNFIASIGHYWIERTAKMLSFEASCTGPHTRVYYERLCDDPEGTLAGLLEFLDLPAADDSIIGRALSTPHQSGMADYKVDFRKSIGSESIGRGSTLPRLLTSWQLTRINEMLVELKYPSLEKAWKGGLPELLGLKGVADSPSAGEKVIEQLLSFVADRAADPASAPALVHAPFDIVVHTMGRERVIAVRADSSVVLDGAGAASADGDAADETKPDGSPRLRFIGKDDVMLEILAGKMSLAEAINDMRLRVVGAGDPATVRGRNDNRRLLSEVGTLLRQ